MTAPRLHFTSSDAPDAQAALAALRKRYDDAGEKDPDIIIALGGDGFMLQALHKFLNGKKPIYGMNLGSVGFLMNEYREEGLTELLAAADHALVNPLRMEATTASGETHSALAFNEVSLLRETRQAAK